MNGTGQRPVQLADLDPRPGQGWARREAREARGADFDASGGGARRQYLANEARGVYARAPTRTHAGAPMRARASACLVRWESPDPG